MTPASILVCAEKKIHSQVLADPDMVFLGSSFSLYIFCLSLGLDGSFNMESALEAR